MNYSKNNFNAKLFIFILFMCVTLVIVQPLALLTTLNVIGKYIDSDADNSNFPSILPSPSENDEISNSPSENKDESLYADLSSLPDGNLVISDRELTENDVLSTSDIYNKLSASVVSVVGERNGGLSLGTGVTMSEDGYIITNNHVISGSTYIYIITNNNVAIEAKIVGTDEDSDLALLKADGIGYIPAEFGDSSQVSIGDYAVCIGTPYSIEYAQTVTDGIISGIRTNVYVNNKKFQLLQTNAQLNPGNSGGPLINQYGQVIGINCSKIMEDSTDKYEGMGFSIPSKHVQVIINGFLSGEKPVGKPIIGLNIVYIDAETAEQNDLVEGAYVASIDTDSHAFKQGIRAGAVILELNGKSFKSTEEFIAEKDAFKAGDTIKIKFWQNGKTQIIDVLLLEDMT